MDRNQILQIAKKELGTIESPPNSNKTKYGIWYGINGQKWCAIFVSWVFNETGLPLGNIQTKKGIHHCQSAYNYYKTKGLLTSSPSPGDIVLYDWKGDGYADHIGIFIRWLNNGNTSFEAYEGNTSSGNESDGGKVMVRTRSRNLVKGFVNPGVYANQSILPVKPKLEHGDRGSKVALFQKQLFEIGYEIAVDGWFGNQTEGFVKDFQKKNHMTISGVADELTQGAVQEEAGERKIAKAKLTSGSYLVKGNLGIAVVMVQEALNKKNSTLNLAENGIFDQVLWKAVKKFQAATGLAVDGIIGPKTLLKLGLT